jgi:DNA-binding beta-propeller fold protein YncE
MAWDSGTDTLWYLERNSETIVNMTLEGATIASFPHPARLHQDRVINYGLAVDGARGVLYLSSAGRFEHEITKVVELTRSGRLTGFEVPVGSRYYDRVRGFALDPDGVGLLAASAWGEVADLTLYRAFDPLPPVADLACAPEGTSVRLAWTSAAAYEAVAVERDGEEAALLAGGEESWLDLGAPPGLHVYRVTARAAGLESAASVCEAAPDRGFLRGDVEENDVLNITDGVAILGHLFLGSLDLTCPDAADVNDSGDLNITDALAVLNYLFLSGAPPAAPYPLEGLDPTPDALPCPAAAP